MGYFKFDSQLLMFKCLATMQRHRLHGVGRTRRVVYPRWVARTPGEFSITKNIKKALICGQGFAFVAGTVVRSGRILLRQWVLSNGEMTHIKLRAHYVR